MTKRQTEHSSSFTVFVVSREDGAAVRALLTLSSSINGLRGYAIVHPEDNKDLPVDPAARVSSSASHGGEQHLFAWLTTNFQDLTVVRVAVIQSAKLSGDSQKSLLATASWLSERCNTYAPNVTVKQVRIGAFCEGRVSDALSLFVDGAALNLVVVPRDSMSHSGMTQPVTDTQFELLVSHIQIEVATLFGLWMEMSSCVIDEFSPIAGGDGRVWIRFVGSRALVLECPPLPIASVVDGEDDLATPVDCEAFPNSVERLEAITRTIYPDELRFNATEPSAGTVSADARSFWRQYLSEFWRTLIKIPRLMLRDLQGDLDELSAIALQEAVGGTNSSLRILFAEESSDLPLEISPEQIEKMIKELTSDAESSRLVLEGRHWDYLVRKSLSFVDGSELASLDRTKVAQENWLVVDKDALAPGASDISETLRAFDLFLSESNTIPGSSSVTFGDKQVPNASFQQAETTADLELGLDASSHTGDKVSAGFGGEAHDDLEASYLEAEESVLAPPMSGESLVAPSKDSEPSEHSVSEADYSVADKRPTNLFTAIAAEFMSEAEKAGSRVKQMTERLRSLPGEFQARDAAAISATIRVALFSGLAFAYLVTGTLTGRRDVLSGELLTSYTKDFIWTLGATLIVCVAVAGLLIKTTGRWQARTIAAISMSSTVIALEWAFFSSIREFVLSFRPLRSSVLIGALVMAATIVVTLVSYTRNRFSKNLLRRRFASILLGTLCVFCLIGITAYLGNDRSPLRDISNQTQQRLMIVGYVLAASLFVGGAAIYAFIVLRERYRLNLLSETLRWAELELRESALADRILRRAAVQWAGTAAVLARLVRYPLGRATNNSAQEESPAASVSPQLMKFAQASIHLSDRGQHGLASRLRLLFIRRGWLTSQYRQLTKAFQKDWAFSKGLDEEDSTRIEPESCPVAPTWSDVVSDTARGSRWQFMRSVFAGKFDGSLLVQSGDVRLEDAYSTILSDRAAHSVGTSKELDSQSYFKRLIPSGARMLDGGLVTTVFSGNDPKQQMRTHVWWPSDLVSIENTSEGSQAEIHIRTSEVLTPDRISSTIRLFGSCVSVSELFTTDEIAVVSRPS